MQEKLIYYPTTTKEESAITGRITTRIERQELFRDLDLPTWQEDTDRVMICGSLPMNHDLISLCELSGLSEGSNSAPGHYVVERAFTG